MIRFIPVILITLLTGTAWAVTSQQIASRYQVIGVIAEDKQGEADPQKKGGIAVIKDTATGKTLVLKAGLPFPGQSEIKITQIKKKGVIVASQRKNIMLTQYGFSGYEGAVASTRPISRPSNRQPVTAAEKRNSPWGDERQPVESGEIPPPPPFPEEIDELFFQEFGEAPIPPEVFEDQGTNQNNRPLTREELMEKYDFDPEEFNNQELENMVSPPPAPWSQ